MSELTPIFLLSLPRSGSTFVQRVLAAQPGVATTAEPWLLLPYLYTLRQEGAFTEYGHRVMTSAVSDFCAQLPGGRGEYVAELRSFVTRLYARVAPEHGMPRYFLDKTPRYHLVVEELLEVFPDAKYIVLWRHPLSVVSSMVELWGRGRWRLDYCNIDLYDGLSNLVEVCERHANRICATRYEDLVTGDQGAWARIFDYLDFGSPLSVERFVETKLGGRMGDPDGTRRYRTLSTEPIDKWRTVVSNPLRREWCRRYLLWIGNERLATMGYELKQMLADLDALPPSRQGLVTDALAVLQGLTVPLIEPALLRTKLRAMPHVWRLPPHR
jgi:hypothetical protein